MHSTKGGQIYFPAITNLSAVDRVTETNAFAGTLLDLKHECFTTGQLVALYRVSDEL